MKTDAEIDHAFRNVVDPPAVYQYRNRARCKRCGAPVVWFLTPRGKKMIVDEHPFRERLATMVPLDLIDPTEFSIERNAGRELVLPFVHQLTCVPGRR